MSTTEWHTYDSRAEAETARAGLLKAIERRAQNAAALTFADAIKDFCASKTEDCSAGTVETIRGRLVRFFSAAVDKNGRPAKLDLARPARLTEDGAQALYDALRPIVSVQEHRHSLSRAKALGAWMVAQGHWTENPIAGVEPKGKPNRGKPQLTRDEARTLRAWCLKEVGDEGAAATAVLVSMGLRASELCELRVRDLDDGATVLHVRGTKTEAAVRDLGIPYPTKERPDRPDLRALFQRQAERAKRRPSDQAPAVSPRLWGRDRWWVRREVARCCQAAGVPVVPPQGLRGTFASLARRAAVAPLAVADSMGHAGTAIQDRHYVRPEAAAAGQQEAAEEALRTVSDEAPRTE